MCVDDAKVNTVTFAVDLADVGYKVGMFGKYLNSWSGKIQPGFSRWFANGGGNYFNTSFNDDRSPTGMFHANASFYAGYQTSILGNVSINWIKEVVTKNGTAGAGYKHPPFFAYVGVHAPHLPSSPAPWYEEAFTEPSLANHYRTPNFNYSANDHHWCVAQQPAITDTEAVGIDALFRDRWRTLLSVDDLVEGVVNALTDLGVEGNTYFFYSSDHGYNLGQLRLTGNKLHAYEHTLRIPMYVRGPLIKPGTKLDIPGSNTDFAPTWLSLAGITNPHMDGTSFAAHLMPDQGAAEAAKQLGSGWNSARSSGKPWRDFHYSEYNSLGNLWRGGGEIVEGDHLIDDPVSHTYRALRFRNSSVYGNVLYAEYTSLIDWNFQNYSSPPGVPDPYSYKFYELFDLDADPWQKKNMHQNASAAVKTALHMLVAAEFKCSGETCA
jgi:N-acetylglucosamine-6-sulfatase